MKKKIRVWALFLARHIGAVTQLRFIIPFNYFPQAEFDFVYAPSFKAAPRLLNIPRIIVFHRDICPFREISKIIEFARLLGIITIIDMDDLLTGVPAPHPTYPHYREIKPHLEEALKAVDIITVTTDRLKEYYMGYNPNIYVLSNFLDERIWNNSALRKRRKNDKIIIGYAGLPAHVYDFGVVTPAIKYILSKYNDRVCFKFIGCMPAELAGVSGVEYVSELTSYHEYSDILMNSGFDFAIAPLEDNAFNQCKSNIKFLEYSICGYAAIYSAVGPYIDSVVPFETGILAKNTTNEWISAMELLIDNTEMRRNLGRNAFLHVKTNYSPEKKSKEWYKFYSRIAASLQEKRNTGRFSFAFLTASGYFLLYVQVLNLYHKIREKVLNA